MSDSDSHAEACYWDGVDFSYAREGTGPAVALIGSSRFYSRAFSPALREYFEFVFADSRHFIPSYRPCTAELGGLTAETFAADVEALRAHLGIEGWAVLGHSVHAQIALAYAAKYPQRTSHVVLVAGLPYSWTEREPVFEEFWEGNASPGRKDRHAANRLATEDVVAAAPEGRKLAAEYIANPGYYWADPAYDSAWLWEGVECGPAFHALHRSVPSRAEARAILEAVVTPTLLVLGKLDYAIPHAAWEEIIAGLPHLTYILLDEAGHNPQTEAPGQFGRVLAEWLPRH